MKGDFLKKVLYSPWLLAGIPFIVILFFLKPLGMKYRFSIEEKDAGYSNDIYADLNSDSVTEVVRIGKGLPWYNIIFIDNDQRVYDQWNFTDHIDTDLSVPFVGNYDNDRYSEVYLFTYEGDSLFLNANEFFEPAGLHKDKLYVTNISIIDGKVTSMVFPAGFYDRTGDGIADFYFTINTGFGLEPRRAYCYDFVKEELLVSDFTGIICQNPVLSDVDGDSKPELFGNISSSGNYKTKTPFSDYSSWLLVFNEDLKFEFPPVQFKGMPNSLVVKPFDGCYLVSHSSGSADTSIMDSRIMKWSAGGQLLKEVVCKDLGLTIPRTWVDRMKDKAIVFSNDIVILDTDLKEIKRIKNPCNSTSLGYITDIDNNGEDEILIYSYYDGSLLVYSGSLKKMGEGRIQKDLGYLKFSSLKEKGGRSRFFLNSAGCCYFLDLSENELYPFTFFAYPGIYLICFLFIILIRKITIVQITQMEDLKKRLISLQLQGIKAQMDPHFTFNTLNSVASLIYLGDRETAYDYMNRFTMMLRNMLNDAERIYRSLDEEIEFVTTYLELEKLRFGEKIDYIIKVGEGISRREEVPKLVLHTFAENAIKHGLMPLDRGGMLKIDIRKEGGFLKLSIEDNGIGRERSAGNRISTGKGLKVTWEFYDILNRINERHIRHKITDLYNGLGEPAGTLVEIWVPEMSGK